MKTVLVNVRTILDTQSEMMQKFHSEWGECFNGVKCGREVAEYEVCEALKSGDLDIPTFESIVSGEW